MEVVGARQGEQKENTFSSCQLKKNIVCSTSSFSDSEVVVSQLLQQPNNNTPVYI